MTDRLLQQVRSECDAVPMIARAENIITSDITNLHDLLIACLGVLNTVQAMDAREREAYLSQLYRDATDTMDTNTSLQVGNFTGFDVAIMLCVFKINPFKVARLEQKLDLESIAYKFLGLQQIETAYTSGRQLSQPAPPEAGVAPPDWNADEPFDSTPEELLYTLMRALVDSTYSSKTIRAIALPTPPTWVRAIKKNRNTLGTIGSVDVFTGDVRERYVAGFATPLAVVRLMRALLATLYARQHARDDSARDALPRPTHWALYSTDGTSEPAPGALEFGVVCRLPEAAEISREASPEELETLLITINEAIDLSTPFVPRSDTYKSAAVLKKTGRVSLRLAAFLGAQFPRLTGTAPGGAQQAVNRYRSAMQGVSIAAEEWFSTKSNKKLVGTDATKYTFAVPASKFHFQQIQAQATRARQINSLCRRCGRCLDGAHRTAIICTNHANY